MVIFYIIILIALFSILMKKLNLYGVFIGVSVLILTLGLASNNTDIGLIGLIMCIVSFILMCALPTMSKENEKKLIKDTKEKNDYVEEWGTIDYKEK